MSGIKTGTPGFVNPVDGKVYTVDPSNLGDPTVNPIAESKDSGDMTVDYTVKDISKETRVTLGKYLSELSKGKIGSSKGVSNKYSIDPSTDSTQQISLSDEKGMPAPLAPSQNSEKFSNDLPSSFSKNYPSIKEHIKKGKSSSKGVDGNDLLPDATENESPVGVYVNSVVDPNKFDSNSTYLDPGVDPLNPLPPTYEANIHISKEYGAYTEANKEPLTLQEMIEKSSEVTSKNQFFADPTTKNFDLFSTTDPATNLPSPFNVSSQDENSYVSRDKIVPDYNPGDASFGKGKTNAKYNGHTLLSSDTIPGNVNVVSPSARYIRNELDDRGEPVNGGQSSSGISQDNPLYSYVGQRNKPVFEVGQTRWASKRNDTNANGFNPTLAIYRDGKKVDVTMNHLAQVGIGLSQRAFGQIGALNSSAGDRYNPTGAAASLSTFPGLPSIGLKIPNSSLTAGDVLDSIEEEFPENSLTSISQFDGQSWGNMTSVDEPFDDASNVGLLATTALMILSIRLLVDSLALILNNNPEQSKNDNGMMVLGQYKKSTRGSFSSNFLGIVETNNSFSEAVAVGSTMFFFGSKNLKTAIDALVGQDSGILKAAALTTLAGLGSSALDGFIDVSSAGSNLAVCRTIIRSGTLIAMQGSNASKQPNVISGIRAATNLFRIIKSSRLIAAINAFAILGDSALNTLQRNGAYEIQSDGTRKVIAPGGYDSMSAKDINHSTIRKNRLTYNKSTPDDPSAPASARLKNALNSTVNYDRTLAWSTARAPSMYLLPKKVYQLQLFDTDVNGENLGSFKGALGLTQVNKNDNFGKVKVIHRHASDPNSIRISGKERQDIEALLDAEYVPFYFHDVRTNEIISFHAFLSSLGDSYSPSYEAVEGFGRVEPVKIYKGTSRKIDMSFHVVATNPDDFDHMWFKINKFVTLVYPQYTAGRDLVGDNYSFKAPFSQLMGSTPLIRIRLGDLFRSNYSRFGLSRLFGAADGDMTLPFREGQEGTSQVIDFKSDAERTESNNKLKTAQKQKIENLFKEKTDQSFVGKKVTFDVSFKSPNFNLVGLFGQGRVEGKITAIKDQNTYVVDASQNVPGQQKQLGEESELLLQSIPNPNAYVTTVLNLEFNKDSLTLTDDEINGMISSTAIDKTKQDSAHKSLLDFMDPSKNAIVKSFESAGGKGLAGVIDSLSFDWYDNVRWNIDNQSVAPMMCKITLSFSPIHDITPGIDHQGYNRAPVYPVGRAMSPVGFKK